MNLRPLGDRILVQPDENPDKIGSFYVPETAKDQAPLQGKVIAVGDGRELQDGTLVPIKGVKAGDRVVWSKFTGNEVKIEGTQYIILAEKDILGVFAE